MDVPEWFSDSAKQQSESEQDTPENTWTFVNTDTVWKYLQKKKKKKKNKKKKKKKKNLSK